MSSKFCTVVLLICLICIPIGGFSQSYYTENGDAVFISRAPMLEFRGTSRHLTGLIDIESGKVDFYLDLNTLDTGIELRNRHMRDSYLKTRRFPFAEFTGYLKDSVDLNSDGIQSVSVSGNFTIHGVTRSITVDGFISIDGNILSLEAEFVVLLEDYNIDRPRVVFYELSDSQIVQIKAKLQKVE